jgi:hypothetical protein
MKHSEIRTARYAFGEATRCVREAAAASSDERRAMLIEMRLDLARKSVADGRGREACATHSHATRSRSSLTGSRRERDLSEVKFIEVARPTHP